MRPPVNNNAQHDLADHEPSREARRHGRLRSELLTCAGLGNVLDMSASGIRVLIKGACKAKAEDIVATELNFEGLRVPVRGRVTWVQKVGFRRHHLGMEFIDLTPEVTEGLRKLARNAVTSLDPIFHA